MSKLFWCVSICAVLVVAGSIIFATKTEADSDKVVTILSPQKGDVLATALPMDALELHPFFGWTNPTDKQAHVSLVYQGSLDNEQSPFTTLDEVVLFIVDGGDQKMWWNPPDNLYDGKWQMKLVVDSQTFFSETFGISSRG